MKKKGKREPERRFSNSIRGVVFDVDGTLYSSILLQSLMALRLLGLGLKKPLSFGRVMKTISNYRKAQEILRRSGVPVDDLKQEQIDLASSLSGLDRETVRRTVDAWMEEMPLRHIPLCRRSGLEAVLRELKRKGYRIGIYSDYPCEKKLIALGIRSLVDAVSCSMDSDIGVFKPHPIGFRVIAQKLGLSTRQIVYVGDRSDVDADGAMSAGMQAVLIRRFKNRYQNRIWHTMLNAFVEFLPEREG